MSKQRVLIKIGGNALGRDDTTVADLVSLQNRGYRPVVVHGGGKTITEWLERMDVPTRFVEGLRVTDAGSIDVVVAVLAGLMNKRIVAEINAAGGRAVGLCGADGGMLRARVKDPELGLVGAISSVDAALLETLLGDGYILVIAPIGVLDDSQGAGTLLNINADSVAAEIGAAVGARQFVFLTDVPGVRGRDGEIVPELSAEEARGLIAEGVIAGGMIPKVEACLEAVQRVPLAVILDGRRPHALRDCMAGQQVGTRIG
ncbi:MAG: acetylglutamate kinase [Chloroflexi bacterium]|nr:acetylglutamate kinase [Chloroflexota bacterium]